MKNEAMQIPEWLRKSAVYQINPRTFTKEGTLNAVKAELPMLREMGFRIMYLCPVFEEDDSTDKANWSIRQIASETENPKNPYRMNDYYKIDSEYGTMDDLRDFISEAHKLGMRVMLDLVYFHIGPNAPILKVHPEFGRQNSDGSFICTYWKFPYLDFNSQGLREYLWCNMTYYVGELDVDGFRCDVGDGIPDDFWAEGARRIKAIKPDAVLINEGTKYYRMVNIFDSSYNFGWHSDVYKCISGEKSVPEIIAEEKKRLDTVPVNGLLLRDMDNHDTVTDWPKRTELVAGHDGMELILALNYCMAGIPMVYCGNELADTSYVSMFANRFHMGKFEATDRNALMTEDYSLRRQSVMKKLNQLLAENDAINGFNMEWLDNDCPEHIISFKRRGESKNVAVIGNLSNEEVVTAVEAAVSGGNVIMDNHAEICGASIKLGAYGYVAVEFEA